MNFDLTELEKESLSFEQVRKTLFSKAAPELASLYRMQRFVVKEVAAAGQIKRWVMTWATSGVAAHPNQTVYLPPGCIITGGGARTNWSGAGNLLTGSYPLTGSIHGWAAEAKDHGESSPASVTVWAIGLEVEGITPT
jgi:hypothetical protein